MSKLNAKKNAPKSTTAPKVAPTAQPAAPAKPKLTKLQRADRSLHLAEKCLDKVFAQATKYGLASLAEAVGRSGNEVETARALVQALPADWAPPARTSVAKADKPALAVGATVSVREKHAAKYAEFMPTANLFVTRAVNGKVMLKAEDGTNYGPIPRGHLCIDATATERAAAEDATPAA